MEEESSDKSLDSLASTTASDVLIRSTSVHRAGPQSGAAAGSSGHLFGSGGDEGGQDVRNQPVDRQSQVPGTGIHGGALMEGGQKDSRQTGVSVGQTNLSIRTHSPREHSSPQRLQDSRLYSDANVVQISLRRLREVAAPIPDFAFKKQDASYIPPALPGNKYPAACYKIEDAENVTNMRTSSASVRRSSPPKVCITKHTQNEFHAQTAVKNVKEGSKCKNKDVHISQFPSGQKETLLNTLNKRSQSAPSSKEVRVKLLDDVAARKAPCIRDTRPNHCEVDCATTIAAATAAAIAATAPVLKAQSDMETQANSVSQLLNKLQEADRQLQRLTEQQSKIQSQPLERSYHHDRVRELESQLTKLTEQRLQHLEKLQQQQIEMQSHFMNSAWKDCLCQQNTSNPGSTQRTRATPGPLPLHQPTVAAAPNSIKQGIGLPPSKDISDHTEVSPLETPAPRKFAPVPIAKDALVHQKKSLEKENVERSKELASLGQVNFLQQILSDGQSTSFSKPINNGHNPASQWHCRNDSCAQLTPDSSNASFCHHADRPPNAAVQKADEVLHDLNALKREMHSMMQEAELWQSHRDDFKPRPVSSPYYHSRVLEKHQPPLPKAVTPPRTRFKEAKRILREVQNNEKVFEENLEAIARAKDGAEVYSLISAMTTDSNVAEKMRIRKAVDEWILKINSEIQDELTAKDSRKKMSDKRECESTQKRKMVADDMKNIRERNIKAPGKNTSKCTKLPSRAPAKTHRIAGESHSKEGVFQALPKKDGRSKEPDESALLDEDTISQIYGRPIYQGHRRTLKNAPYLRFSSPSPKSKPQRPKVLEIVKGVKMKSAKVQTSRTEYKMSSTKPKARDLFSQKDIEPKYMFIPASETTKTADPLEGHLIPMAIPLGRTQSSMTAPMPSSVIVTEPLPVTVNVSIPPSPKPQLKSVKPNIAVVEIRSEKKDPPQLTVEVLPCVDIDSVVSDSMDASQSLPSAEAASIPPSPAQPDIQLPTRIESEEEELAFPGSSFVQVTDMIQEDDDEADRTTVPLLELNGWTGPVSQYNGIPFPPPAPAPQVTTDILDEMINKRETLENRLVSWVEQELMARIINEMHPLRAQAVPDVSLSSSEESVTVASDIVETAGGEGLQLFVDAGVPVDSSLIRNFVEEALSEMIAGILREREERPIPILPPEEPGSEVPVEIPHVPTPQCTPSSSPLPPAETSIVKTPDLSPQTSVAEPAPPHGPPEDAGQQVPASPLRTPSITPVASPPRVATPTPPLSEEIEDQVETHSTVPPNPWSSSELPLDEENPHTLKAEAQLEDALVMTVERDEEPESLFSAASPQVDRASISPPPEAPTRDPSPVSSPSSAPSSEESSDTVTDANSSDRPISEGEILFSYGQIVAARAVAEGGLVYPNLAESLSSTLKDAQEMEYDPPSEGQVIHGSTRGAHRDPMLSLLAQLNQDPFIPHEAIYHQESSEEENSMGEISEGQRPRLTAAAEKVLVGHSTLRRQTNAGQPAGLVNKHPPEPSNGGFDNVSSGPMSIGELESRMASAHRPVHSVPEENGPAQALLLPIKEHQPARTRFIHVGVKSIEDLHQETQEDLDRTLVEASAYLDSQLSGTVEIPREMSLTVPSMNEADRSEDMKTAVDSDSSGADTF